MRAIHRSRSNQRPPQRPAAVRGIFRELTLPAHCLAIAVGIGVGGGALCLGSGLEEQLSQFRAQLREFQSAAPQQLKQPAAALASALLESLDDAALSWSEQSASLTNAPPTRWRLEQFPSADGDKTAWFLTWRGGPGASTRLRSRPFAVPESSSFWLAGHGAGTNTLVRLRAADTESVLEEAASPASEAAQRVAWNLAYARARPCILEVSTGGGAMEQSVAIGRFEPAVLAVAACSPSLAGERLRGAAELAQRFELRTFAPRFQALLNRPVLPKAMQAAVVETLAVFQRNLFLAALAPLIADEVLPDSFRREFVQAALEKSQPAWEGVTQEVFRAVPLRLQTQLALGLASTQAGAESLLGLIAAGHASPNVLEDDSVKARLAGLDAPSVRTRADYFARHLRTRDATTAQRIAALLPGAAPRGSVFRGEIVFTQNCRVCHQTGGIGGMVGPALDGVGIRSEERLLEDVFDPSLNVERTYRSTTLVLGADEEVTGLLRREEGENLVIADRTGKEILVESKLIKSRQDSELSLMPENFLDLLTPEEVGHLRTYLRSLNTPRLAP